MLAFRREDVNAQIASHVESSGRVDRHAVAAVIAIESAEVAPVLRAPVGLHVERNHDVSLVT